MMLDVAQYVYDHVEEAVEQGRTTISAQGSARSGKTYNIIIFLIQYLKNHPGLRASVVRKTLPALKGSVLVDFKEILMKTGIYKEKNFNKSELIYTFDNGSWVEFFSCDNEQKLRGRKRDILFVNEANELSYMEWQQLKMRTTQWTILDYNPSFTEDHWINAVNDEPETYFFISTYKNNPFLEDTIVKEIERLKETNQNLWRVYGLGLRGVIEGLIFPEITLVDAFPENLKHIYRGMDFGYSNDVTSIVKVGWRDKMLYVDEQCYKTEMLSTDIISKLKETDERLKIISESADPRLVQEIYRAGLDIHPVQKYKGSIEAGLNKMKEFEICVTKSSLNTIKEFRNYTYRQDKEGRWLNEPIDTFNHSIDAIRYVVLTEILGGRPKPVDLKRIRQLA